MGAFPFNVRVYIVLFHSDRNHVLVSDELIRGNRILKFPGGGLEFGEGTLECARREAREELGIEIATLEHYYTTDFFIPSVFNPKDQVISIYYSSIASGDAKQEWLRNLLSEHTCRETGERFFWKNIAEISDDFLTFPGDRAVVKLLQAGL